MHTHVSIWKDGTAVTCWRQYAGVSQEALHAIGGILKHFKALCALTNPTTNSYKRLVPGYEAPVNLEYVTERSTTELTYCSRFTGKPYRAPVVYKSWWSDFISAHKCFKNVSGCR
ncbi:MAG: hypothetical protein R2860_09185 [Desulfobacterales bacterium]